MLASALRDALLGGVFGLATVGGTVMLAVGLLAMDRRRRGQAQAEAEHLMAVIAAAEHPSNPDWEPHG